MGKKGNSGMSVLLLIKNKKSQNEKNLKLVEIGSLDYLRILDLSHLPLN